MDATVKLISDKGTILGTIWIPMGWLAKVRQQGGIRLRYESREEYEGRYRFDATAPYHAISARTFAIVADYGRYRATGVRLQGITPEELETLPECSFAPGAAYMRSLLKEGT
jgi:hypothetical protein